MWADYGAKLCRICGNFFSGLKWILIYPINCCFAFYNLSPEGDDSVTHTSVACMNNTDVPK